MESTVDVIDKQVVEISESIQRTAKNCLEIKQFCIDNCKTGRAFINNYNDNDLRLIVYGNRNTSNDIKYAPEITAVKSAFISLKFKIKDMRDTLLLFNESHKEVLDIVSDLDLESDNLDKANRFVRYKLHAILDKIQICLNELEKDMLTEHELNRYIAEYTNLKDVYHSKTLSYVAEMIARLSFIDASMCTLHKAMVDYLDSINISSSPLADIRKKLSEFSGGVN
jgi:hypothetical protein